MMTEDSDPVEAIRRFGSIECGTDAAKHFSHAEGYRNLNHGSFGTYPTIVKSVLRDFQDRAEARPDTWIRYEEPQILDKARAAVSKYLHAPMDACVFVNNASTGVNTVLRSLIFQPGDVIIYFATIYSACEKTISYICETTPAESTKIKYTYPVSDTFLCSALEETITSLSKAGKNPKICIFDTIVSLPGVRMPFEDLTSICRTHSVLSLIDGAHGIGHIPLNLTTLDPDFFVSNCHKWLHVPRGCAIFYVPQRNQHLIRSSIPTSHGFVPRPREGEEPINNPLPPSGKSEFVTNFEFVGTLDVSPYSCVPAGLEWRRHLRWRGREGEDAIFAYMRLLAKRSGEIVVGILGTEVLENKEGTLGRCCFSNVRLPLNETELSGGDVEKRAKIGQWIVKVLVEEYDTFIAIIFFGGAWWVRLSAQVYLTEEDFEWAGNVLKEVCARVKKGEWAATATRSKL